MRRIANVEERCEQFNNGNRIKMFQKLVCKPRTTPLRPGKTKRDKEKNNK